MKFYRLYPLGFFALALLGGLAASRAQAPSIVDGCVYNSAGVTFGDKQIGALQCNSSGQLLTSASVSASITPLAPTTKATLAVSSISSNVVLPAGTTTSLCNLTATTGYYKFGAAGVTATTSDLTLQGGECIALSPGTNTYLAGITASGTATFDITGGAGLPTYAFGPSAAVSSNIAQINGVTVSIGSGISDTGVQRVTLPTDAPTFGATTPATAPTVMQLIGGVYTSTPPVLTTGQSAALRVDVDGSLMAYAPNIATTGTITTQNLNLGGAATAGSAITTITDGRGAGTVQVTGTWTGTLILQLTTDGTTWVTAGGSPFQNDNTGVFSSTIPSTANGIWTIEVGGHAQWRITASTAVTGTATVTTLAAQGTDRVNIGSNPTVIAAGVGAEASASAGNPVRVAGWNGTNTYTLKTDTAGQLLLGATANVVGKVGIDQTTPGTTNLVATNADASIAPGAAPAKAVVIGGVYNSTAPTFTTGQTGALQQDVDGSLYVNVRDQTIQRTYRAGMVGLVPAAAATDVFGVCGSATKTVILTRFQATGIATAATAADAITVKRSTADTLGTSTAPALVPLDSASVAATATALGYTANPTVGVLVGNVASQKIVLTTGAAASQMYPLLQYWPNNITQGLMLRGTAECAYLNWNAQTIAGNSINVDVEWIETP